LSGLGSQGVAPGYIIPAFGAIKGDNISAKDGRESLYGMRKSVLSLQKSDITAMQYYQKVGGESR